MRISEILNEAKYNYSLADYQEVPLDSFEKPSKNILGFVRNPNIGPQEGKYLNLMLRGMKPAAGLSIQEYNKVKKEYKPYINDGTIKIAAKNRDMLILTLPGEEWRGPKLLSLWKKLGEANRKGLDANPIHAKIGVLLGIPKESIRYFLSRQ